jgi:hypothetical protein
VTVAAVVMIALSMWFRFVGMRAVVMVGMAEPVSVAVAVAAKVFVGEGLSRHSERLREKSETSFVQPCEYL